MAVHGTQWELSEWGDGSTCLTFWDSMHGNDVRIILNADGTTDIHTLDWPESGIGEPTDVLTRIDLVQWLRQRASEDSARLTRK